MTHEQSLQQRVTDLEKRVAALEHDHTARVIHAIQETEARIMSAISEFAAQQRTFNTQIGSAIDGIVTDLADLNALILQLQTTPGPISPEDQATLDELQTAGTALAARVKAVDDMNPPKPPAG